MKKKILIVCNSEFVYEKFISETYISLKNKYKIDIVIGHEKEFKKKLKKKNIYYIDIPKNLFKLILQFPRICCEILNLLKQNNYNAIIHNNRNTSICSRLSLFFFYRKITSIYFARGMYFHDNQNILSYFFSYLIEIFFLLKTDLILSQTKEDLKKIKTILKFFKVETAYVGNGTDFKFNKKKNLFKNRTFVTICRITQNKGLEDLAYAFSKISKIHKNLKLLIIGGPRTQADRIYFNKTLKKLNLKKVKITGLVGNVSKYLESGQIYILPSYREGLSRSLIESMASGLVPIASNIRGVREVIKNNYNGLIYKFGDKKDLLKKMDYLLNLNSKSFFNLQKNSIKSIKKRFTKKLYIKRQIFEIDKILGARDK